VTPLANIERIAADIRKPLERLAKVIRAANI
jgi:hypothetical protein